ncbi:MAG: divalent-cation tolerance protein CutA [Candidatus Altiarchaeota archaeon]
MTFIVVYITHSSMAEARRVVSHLLKLRLIACANFFPIRSMYWWRRKVEDSKEVVSLVKTSRRNWRKLKAEVEKIHPYKVPCIMRLDAKANRAYERWIARETRGRR